ncbi:unnamed protein product [Allacma fusca]|uniref:Ig-like domain-containing protein n=1 Tax=Allacma fusca TaxID=39272 RepID=A0A8J2JVS5_9HEXA|nr:unnamed protein product [Allacma fusca]
MVYVTVVAVSFALDWPVVTRGTFGQLFILICRQMWPQVRLLPEAYFFWGQLACCIVYLYCVWVNRTIFMHMHSFSLILRNASYQWNLNFAIRFQLIVTYYRAHLLRIATQGNMIRLYNQHRLIVGLCNYYGKVFLHPLCIYMVTNMGVVTVIMIYFIRYEEKDPKEFNYDYKIQFPDNITDAVIYYTLPKQHEVTTVFVVLVQCLVDFIQGTLGISWGSQAVQESFEFVRRHGLIQCNTRHERRMIHSLYMSFSDPNSPLITADSYFGMTKAKIFSGIMVMAFFWTMIIQCQVEAPSALIEWVPNSSETCIGLPAYEDDLGRFYCMKGHKMRMKVKNRTRRNRFSEILKQKISYDPNLNFWFFENCYDPIFTAAQSKVLQADFGMCRVTFTGVP